MGRDDQEFEGYRRRCAEVVEKLPQPSADQVVFDASHPMPLLDVIEATAEIDGAGQAWVKLPRGYATVEFLRMLFAVSG
jgi:hypothetical protein